MIKKIKLFVLLFVILLNTQAQVQNWIQIGNDIKGEKENSHLGGAVSLSSNGSIVAISSGLDSSNVKVFQNNSGIWTQIGTNIYGEDYANAISLSSDGSIVAIGIRTANKNSDTLWSGLVSVYKNIDGIWTQIGEDIKGRDEHKDCFGQSVSLSSDGSIIAIGASETEYNSGYVRIYQNNAGVWTQIGTELKAEGYSDTFGCSLSLSSDGSVVAIGAENSSGTNFQSGHVKVYKNISGVWTQLGANIQGEAEYDHSGSSVSLSSDGTIVAIGAIHNNNVLYFDAGHVRIYKYISGVWTQIGEDIDGIDDYGEFGGSVSLSSDGLIVAIGAGYAHLGTNGAGYVGVYRNVNDKWIKEGSSLSGSIENQNFGGAVSLSSDGSTLAVGATGSNDNGIQSGKVKIFEFREIILPNITTQPVNQNNICPGSSVSFSISGVNLDSCQWQIKTGSGYVNLEDDSIYSNTNSQTLTVSGITASLDDTNYRCYVKSFDGTTTSNDAILSVKRREYWKQIGNDINGKKKDDCFGSSVSFNSDGSVVAVGASNNAGNAYVEIYKNTGNIWIQKGDSIEIKDLYGVSVSLNSDGSVVAIGTIGYVKIYNFVDSMWVLSGKKNNDINASMFGCSVSLDSSGTIVAIGAYGTNGVDGSALTGSVNVYKNIAGEWIQIGSSIYGENAYDFSGSSVRLNSNGSIVAIGAPGNDGINGDSSGHVRVYENFNNEWIQIGSDIDGEYANNKAGSSVSINSNGTIVAIGSLWNSESGKNSGHVRVYENINNEWIQIGSDIDGEYAGDASGSVSINYAGTIVAIGASQNNGYLGHVRIYRNINNQWIQIGSDIDGNAFNGRFGGSLSLNSYGNIVAIGGFVNDIYNKWSGHVRVLKIDTLSMISPINLEDITEECTITVNPPSTTNYCGNLIIGTTSDSLTYSSLGTHVIEWTFDDGKGNNIKANQNIIIKENTTAPIIICQKNQEVIVDETNVYSITDSLFDPIIIDICGIASLLNDFSNTETLFGSQLPIGTTTIQWIVKDYDGLISTCSFDVVANNYLGIEKLQNGISIYPNPTNGKLNLEFSNNNIEKLFISDLTGKILFIKDVTSKVLTIDLSNFSNGIYFLQIQSDKDIFTNKIIKE